MSAGPGDPTRPAPAHAIDSLYRDTFGTPEMRAVFDDRGLVRRWLVVEAALARAESLGGSRMMGPEEVMEGVEIGLFNDPEGHTVGVVRTVS